MGYCSVLVLVILASISPFSLGGCCPNACSGHGSCDVSDACTCYSNWQNGENSNEAGDCGSRRCPFEIAWSDAPTADGRYHKYAECANEGICNRETGECECFEGYTGKGCQRMKCPLDCNEYGRCTPLNDIGYGVSVSDYYAVNLDRIADDSNALGSSNFPDPHKFEYYNWDKDRSSVCVCDPGYQGVDCSLRICPHGTDVVTTASGAQVHRQVIALFGPDTGDTNTDIQGVTQEFALTFTAKTGERLTTIPIDFIASDASDATAVADAVEEALQALPNNVIDSVEVYGFINPGNTEDGTTIVLDGTALPASGAAMVIFVDFDGTQVQGTQNMLEVEWKKCDTAGCTPFLAGMSLIATNDENIGSGSYYSTVFVGEPADNPSLECGGRGKCDYEFGICNCFSGYYGLHCEQITALV